MPKFESTRRVSHSAQDMFALVADVESYPEFISLCESLTIRQRRARDGQEVLVADMTVGYKSIRETFTSQVQLTPSENRIRATYLDGPFKHLDNRWHFIDREDGTSDVHFYIEYEFKSRVLGALMGAMFDRAFRKFSADFEARADAIYKTAATPG
ncbi:MAG: type II toxin-antitoxin system RatA family toxin [Pseudomonadota bacterium]